MSLEPASIDALVSLSDSRSPYAERDDWPKEKLLVSHPPTNFPSPFPLEPQAASMLLWVTAFTDDNLRTTSRTTPSP